MIHSSVRLEGLTLGVGEDAAKGVSGLRAEVLRDFAGNLLKRSAVRHWAIDAGTLAAEASFVEVPTLWLQRQLLAGKVLGDAIFKILLDHIMLVP